MLNLLSLGLEMDPWTAQPRGPRVRSSEELSTSRLLLNGSCISILMAFGSYGLLDSFCDSFTDPEFPYQGFPALCYRAFALVFGLLFGYLAVGLAVLVTMEVCTELRRLMDQSESPGLGNSPKLEIVVVEKKKENSREDKGEEEACPICLEDLNKSFGYVRLRDCMHKFHRCCIDRWLFKSARCPTCRSFAIRNMYL